MGASKLVQSHLKGFLAEYTLRVKLTFDIELILSKRED
jgi:hypothetical protein